MRSGIKGHRGPIKTNGQSGSKKRYYRWDHTHNDIEVFDKNGNHLGSMDPVKGEIYRGPQPTHNLPKKDL